MHSPTASAPLLRRTRIGFVFQFFNLLPNLNGRRKRRPAADAGRRRSGQGPQGRRGQPRARRHDPASQPLSRGNVRRRDAARRHRPRPGRRPRSDPLRRADRQSRLGQQRGDPQTAPQPCPSRAAVPSSWSRTIPTPPPTATASSTSATDSSKPSRIAGSRVCASTRSGIVEAITGRLRDPARQAPDH